MRFWQIDWDKPLSVVIGRIVVRVLIVALVVWALINGYRSYQESQRAKEIAPVHAFAILFLEAFKNGEYFKVQEKLEPDLQHFISIDYLADFAQKSELNATIRGNWNQWSKRTDRNSTIYILHGNISYQTGRKNPMKWEIRQTKANMSVIDLQLGKRALRPPKVSPF